MAAAGAKLLGPHSPGADIRDPQATPVSSQASGFPTLSLDDQIPALVTPLEQMSGPFQKHRSAPSLPIHRLPPGLQHQSLCPCLPAWPTPILLNSAEAPCEPPSIPGRAPASGEGRPVVGPGGAGAVLPRSMATSAGASSHRGPECVRPHCRSISQQGWFQGGREIVPFIFDSPANHDSISPSSNTK